MRLLAILSLCTALRLSAAPVVVAGAGPDPASVTPFVQAFRTLVGGGPVAGPDGAFGGVRREINWDGVPDAVSAPNAFPANFFLTTSPRGVSFTTPGTAFQVSANVGAGVEFGNIDPSYPGTFLQFSPLKLFTPIGSNITDVYFFEPATAIPATVTAFGAVFTDVDGPSTTLTFFDLAGNAIGTPFVVPPFNGGLSFLGVAFNGGERVARVRITTGNTPPAAGVIDGGPNDVVVMDDFIYSEPLAPHVSVGDTSVSEGGNASFTVQLNYAVATATQVSYSTADGTAQATLDNDYTAAAPGASVTIPAGSTTATITIPTTNDSALEPDETFFVNLLSAGTVTITDAQGQATIVNDDSVPAMTIGDATLSEGNGGTTAFTFTVTLSNPSSTPVSASWATADGTAANPSDYATASGTVLFSPGDVSETITISVVGDTAPEPDETFVVGLSGAAGATIGDSEGTGTILNDDVAAGAAVPTLSEWMLIALAGLLVAVAASKVR